MAKERVFICGAGHQGLSMAAHLSLYGVDVCLWNRTPDNIREVVNSGVIHCSGVVNGDARINRISYSLEDVCSYDYVMITTPSSAHKELAQRLAPYVNKHMTIVLNPGRTFGAVEFAEELAKHGVSELPVIAEAQTIVYTCRRVGANSVIIYAFKSQVEIASLHGTDVRSAISKMPSCLREYFVPVSSVAYTSLSNVGMILHCAPVLMNIGWIESETVDFKYYYDGISKTIAGFLEKIDQERLRVSSAAGYPVESVSDWLKRTYNVEGCSLFECLRNNSAYKEIDAPRSINTRYILEDVPNGLVPIEALGKDFGIETPNISTIIDLASSIMDIDFRKNGRYFSFSEIKGYL